MFQPTKPSIATPKLETIHTTVVPQSITIISAATAEHASRQLGVVSGAPASNKGKSSKRDGVAYKSPPRYSIMHTTITIVPKKQRIRFVPRDRSVSGFSAHIIAITTMMRHLPTTHSFLDVYRRNRSVKRIVPSQIVNVSRGTLKAIPYAILYMMLTPLRKSLCERVVDWDQCLVFVDRGVEWWRRARGEEEAGNLPVALGAVDRWEGFLDGDCEPFQRRWN